jgi:hypothetical protein
VGEGTGPDHVGDGGVDQEVDDRRADADGLGLAVHLGQGPAGTGGAALGDDLTDLGEVEGLVSAAPAGEGTDGAHGTLLSGLLAI